MLKLNYYFVCLISIFVLNSCTHEEDVIRELKNLQIEEEWYLRFMMIMWTNGSMRI